MNVFISCDMEGATGVVHGDMLMPGRNDYARGRRLLTGDVAAACRGALEAGAERIVVCDGHGTMRNVLIEELPPEVELVVGPASSRALCQSEGLDESFDAALFVGYHARHGAADALLAHTWVGSAIHEINVNGIVFGETALNAGIAGAFDVPVLLVTGDEALAAEAKAVLPEVETVAVKRAVGRASAVCRSPAWSGPAIQEAATRALRRRKRPQPFRVQSPVVIEIGFHTVAMAERALKRPLVERVGPRSVAFSRADYLEAVQEAWRVIESVVAEDPEFLR